MKDILNSALIMDQKISTIKSLIENDKNSGVILISKNQNYLDIVEAIATLSERKIIYFNKDLKNSLNYNLLYGNEKDVIDNLVYLFKKDNKDTQYFKDMGEQFLRNALKILKRFKENNANLSDLNKLALNPAGEGRLMVNKFLKMPANSEIEQKENLDCATYFLENYFNEKSKTYESCISIRNYIYRLTSNNEDETIEDLNFSKIIKDNKIVLIKCNEDFTDEMFLLGLEKSCKQVPNIVSNYLIIDDDNFTIRNIKQITDEENLEILKKKIEIKNKIDNNLKIEKNSFGEIMKKTRILEGLSQAELATKLNITASFIGDVERNEKSLSMPKLIQFCKLFNLSLDELFLD